MKIGIVFGTFAPMHLGHLDVVEIAKGETDRVIVICCGHEGDRGYPTFTLEKRLELVEEQFEDDEKVIVTVLPDTDPEIKKGWSQQLIWDYWVKRMLLKLFREGLIEYRDELIFYTSEGDYTELLESTPEHVTVHKCSRVRPISATMIRENPERYMDQAAEAFKNYWEKEIYNR